MARAIGTLTAALAAFALAGCGGSSGPTPTQVGEQWYRATAAGNGKKMCELSTADRQRRFVEIGKRLPGGRTGASTCAAAVELTLKHFGGSARLSKFSHVHIRLVSQSKTAAVVQAEKAAPLKLVRSGSGWLVAGAGSGG
ncbi:MAG: hypothetical protein ACHQHO_08820 [Solirubrobacterales bacterium]